MQRSVRCHCHGIERARNTLRTTFYATQRPVTLHEVDMILKPLFQQVNLSIAVLHNRVHITVTNTKNAADEETNHAVLDLVNDWNQHDTFRRTLIRGITNANRNKIYRYDPGIEWSCPMDVRYVFDDSSSSTRS